MESYVAVYGKIAWLDKKNQKKKLDITYTCGKMGIK
jgi:hypothetical protein